jgi:hypothetical protein
MGEESGRRMRITAGRVSVEAELNGSETASKVYEALPIRARAQRWGDEIYFEIPVTVASSADARDEMKVGELAYWPPGRAFCIFWGPTPASSGDELRAASAVNPLGMVSSDATVFSEVASGAEIVLEKA